MTKNSEPSSLRVIIVGAGIMGCCTAFYLCQNYGMKPLIIEAVSPGAGASGKAGGFLAREWVIGSPIEELAKLSYDLHGSLADFLLKDYGIDVHYRNVEAWAITLDNKANASVHHGEHWPFWLDGNVSFAKTWQRRQHKSGVLGTASAGKTAQTHPKRLVDGLLKVCLDYGSELKIGKVVDLIKSDIEDSNPWSKNYKKMFSHVILETGEVIYGDICVLAMGPWTYQAQKWVMLPEISTERYHSITLRPTVDCSTPHCLFASWKEDRVVKDCEIYIRPDNEVYVLGIPDDEPIPETSALVNPTKDSCKILRSYAAKFSSILAECDVERTQACYLPLSQDALPVIGKIPGVLNSFIAAGHCQWGILLGPGSGLAMAQLIVQGAAECVNLVPFNPLRFGKRGLKFFQPPTAEQTIQEPASAKKSK